MIFTPRSPPSPGDVPAVVRAEIISHSRSDEYKLRTASEVRGVSSVTSSPPPSPLSPLQSPSPPPPPPPRSHIEESTRISHDKGSRKSSGGFGGLFSCSSSGDRGAGPVYVRYAIEVSCLGIGPNVHVVHRRYNDFVRLRQDLKQLAQDRRKEQRRRNRSTSTTDSSSSYSGSLSHSQSLVHSTTLAPPPPPPKLSGGGGMGVLTRSKFNEKFLRRREVALQRYLDEALEQPLPRERFSDWVDPLCRFLDLPRLVGLSPPTAEELAAAKAKEEEEKQRVRQKHKKKPDPRAISAIVLQKRARGLLARKQVFLELRRRPRAMYISLTHVSGYGNANSKYKTTGVSGMSSSFASGSKLYVVVTALDRRSGRQLCAARTAIVSNSQWGDDDTRVLLPHVFVDSTLCFTVVDQCTIGRDDFLGQALHSPYDTQQSRLAAAVGNVFRCGGDGSGRRGSAGLHEHVSNGGDGGVQSGEGSNGIYNTGVVRATSMRSIGLDERPTATVRPRFLLQLTLREQTQAIWLSKNPTTKSKAMSSISSVGGGSSPKSKHSVGGFGSTGMTESSGTMPPNKRSVANNDRFVKKSESSMGDSHGSGGKDLPRRTSNPMKKALDLDKSRQWEFGDLQAVCRFAPLHVSRSMSLYKLSRPQVGGAFRDAKWVRRHVVLTDDELLYYPGALDEDDEFYDELFSGDEMISSTLARDLNSSTETLTPRPLVPPPSSEQCNPHCVKRYSVDSITRVSSSTAAQVAPEVPLPHGVCTMNLPETTEMDHTVTPSAAAAVLVVQFDRGLAGDGKGGEGGSSEEFWYLLSPASDATEGTAEVRDWRRAINAALMNEHMTAAILRHPGAMHLSSIGPHASASGSAHGIHSQQFSHTSASAGDSFNAQQIRVGYPSFLSSIHSSSSMDRGASMASFTSSNPPSPAPRTLARNLQFSDQLSEMGTTIR